MHGNTLCSGGRTADHSSAGGWYERSNTFRVCQDDPGGVPGRLRTMRLPLNGKQKGKERETIRLVPCLACAVGVRSTMGSARLSVSTETRSRSRGYE